MKKIKGCSLSHGTEYGVSILYLENDLLKVTLLIGKGCEVYAMVWKQTETDVLLKTPKGLKQYEGRNLHEQRLTWYSDLYTGGWQDVLPHRGQYEDIEITSDMYGIAATLPWNYEVLEFTDVIVRIRCFVDLPVVPLTVERIISIKQNDAKLYIGETLRNTGSSEIKFTWTQHSAFGGTFLDESVEIDLPDCVAFKARDFDVSEGTDESRYESPVDSVPLDGGGTFNLLNVPPRCSSDSELFVTLKNVNQSIITLTNRKKKISVRLCWDLDTFPHLRYYYKNNDEIYTIAIEPSNDYFIRFEDSLKSGSYLSLLPRNTHSTWITCEIIGS
jgi:hypothetical protein